MQLPGEVAMRHAALSRVVYVRKRLVHYSPEPPPRMKADTLGGQSWNRRSTSLVFLCLSLSSHFSCFLQMSYT